MGRGPGPRVRLAVLPLNHAVRKEDGTVSTTNTALLDTRGTIKTGDSPPLAISIGSNGIVQSASQNTNVPSIIVSADGKYTLMMTTGDVSESNPMDSLLRRFLLISNATIAVEGFITRKDTNGNLISAGMTYKDGEDNTQLSNSGNNLMGWEIKNGFTDIGGLNATYMVNAGAATANVSIASGSAAFVYVDKAGGGLKITGTEVTATTNAASAAGTVAGGAVLTNGGSGQTWVQGISIPLSVATAGAGADIFIPPRYPDAQIVSDEGEAIVTSSIDYIGSDVKNAAVRINTTEDAFIDVSSSDSTATVGGGNVGTALIASANGVQGSSDGLAYVVSAAGGLDVAVSWTTRVAIMAIGEIASSEGDVSSSYSGGALTVDTTETGENTITIDWTQAF